MYTQMNNLDICTQIYLIYVILLCQFIPAWFLLEVGQVHQAEIGLQVKYFKHVVLVPLAHFFPPDLTGGSQLILFWGPPGLRAAHLSLPWVQQVVVHRRLLLLQLLLLRAARRPEIRTNLGHPERGPAGGSIGP